MINNKSTRRKPLYSIQMSTNEREFWFAVDILDSTADYIDLVGFNIKDKKAKQFVVGYNEYYIRPMTREEFELYYYLERYAAVIKASTMETDAIKYSEELRELWKKTMEKI